MPFYTKTAVWYLVVWYSLVVFILQGQLLLTTSTAGLMNGELRRGVVGQGERVSGRSQQRERRPFLSRETEEKDGEFQQEDHTLSPLCNMLLSQRRPRVEANYSRTGLTLH